MPIEYRREIDGLRAVAVLAVIVYHARNALIPGGYLGVDVFFFVISGFLITGILFREIAQGNFSILKFYERRARRILPALLFMMLVCFPVALYVMLGSQIVDYARSVVSAVLFSSNFLFWSEVDYFASDAELKPLLHTWSLAVEEQFYLFFPLLLTLLRGSSRHVFIGVLLAIAVTSLGLSEYLSRHYPTPNYFLLPSRAWELMVGALCAFWTRPTGNLLNNVLSGFGLIAIVASYWLFESTTPMPSLFGLLPVLGTAAVLLFARPGTVVASLLGLGPMVFIGLVSYSAYLWHQPVFAFARLLEEGELTLPVLPLLIALSFVLAVFTWRFVETPFRHRKPGRLATTRRVLGVSVLASVAMGSLAGGVALAISSKVLTFASDPMDVNVKSAGIYVKKAFEKRRDKEFEGVARPRILIVGDSYGQDFANILIDGIGLAPGQISTHYISRLCGNLFVEDDLTANIAAGDRADCVKRGRYESAELRTRLAQADVVLLASAWMSWEVPYIPETIDNIKTLTKAEILVVGRKYFGPINLNFLANLPPSERISKRNKGSMVHSQVEPAMRNSYGKHFVDVQFIACGSYESCPLYTDEGKLISFDGAHLTREGAMWLGKRLLQQENPLKVALAAH